MQFDEDQIRSWLTGHFGVLLPGEKIETRAFGPGGQRLREFHGNPEEATRWVLSLDPHLDIYAGVNPRLGRDGTKAGVSRILSVWADFDFKHFSSEAAAIKCLDAFALVPTTINHTGNGLHAYWRLAAPPDAQAASQRVESVMKRLYAHLGGLDPVQDLSRVMRIPGTFNNKNPASPAPIRRVSFDGQTAFTVEEIERWLPPTPIAALPTRTAPPSGTTTNDSERTRTSLSEVARMLTFTEPCLDYAAYLEIWMGVASAFPGPEGMGLIDVWSSAPRAENGQSVSPRTEPHKHDGFRRTDGPIHTIATVVHHAKQGGYEPPQPPRPTLIRRLHEPEYRVRLGELDDPRVLDLPLFYQRLHQHLGELTEPFSRDFSTGMIAANLSSLIPQVRFENLNCSLWFLGVAEQSSGKNVLSDALNDIFKRVNTDTVEFTSGTPEGLWRLLNGDGNRVHCYHAEYGAFLAGLKRDFMSGAKESLCNLYDGRAVHHHRSRDGISINNAYVSIVATTTQEGIHNGMERGDLRSGYASRFLVPFSDTINVSARWRPTEAAVRTLADELAQRKKELEGVRYALWDGPQGYLPPAYEQYMLDLGIGTGEIRRFEDALNRLEVPQGRLLARVKKLAAGLEAAEAVPQVRGNTLYIRESNVALAILLVRRWGYGAMALYPLVTSSKDEALIQQIAQFREHPATMTEIVRKTHADIKDIRKVMEFLIEEQSVEQVGGDYGTVPRFRYIARGA